MGLTIVIIVDILAVIGIIAIVAVVRKAIIDRKSKKTAVQKISLKKKK